MTTIVVTGGCGFIGLNLMARLVAERVSAVRVVDNLWNGTAEGLVEALSSAGRVRPEGRDGWTVETDQGLTRVALSVSDIRDMRAADAAVAGAAAVVHLAAQTGVQQSLADPRADVEQNVVGTINYLEACRTQGVAVFIAASTLGVVGDRPPPQAEDAAPRPQSPYGAGKVAVEGYCSAYHRSFGLSTLALRFANVYGPFAWRKGSVVAAMCKAALAGRPLVIDGDGTQTRDFVFAPDLARVIARAALGYLPATAWGRPVNVATGTSTSVADLAARLSTELAAHGIRAETVHAPPRTVDLRDSAPSVETLRALFPEDRMRGLDDGLPQTVGWFARQRRVRGVPSGAIAPGRPPEGDEGTGQRSIG